MPSAQIVVVINTGLKPALVEVFKTACETFGLACVELSDIDKLGGHPTILGMAQIAEQIVKTLDIEAGV